MPDEMMHVLGHRDRQRARVLVQLGLRDQPDADRAGRTCQAVTLDFQSPVAWDFHGFLRSESKGSNSAGGQPRRTGFLNGTSRSTLAI